MNIRVNSDISKYKPSVFGLMSTRNFLVILIGLVVALTVYLTASKYLVERLVSLLVIISEIPVAIFYPDEIPLYSMPAEKIIQKIILDLISPKQSQTISSHVMADKSVNKEKFEMFTKKKFKVPYSVQDMIPLDYFYDDGLASRGNYFSAVYKIADIDFTNLSNNEKDLVLQKYENFLSSFTSDATYKLSIVNRNQSPKKVFYDIAYPPEEEKYEAITNDLNEIKWNACSQNRQLQSDLFLTVTTHKKNIEDARSFFNNVENNFLEHLTDMESQCRQLSLMGRLRLYHCIYNPGSANDFKFTSLSDLNGDDIKDVCAPKKWSKTSNCVEINDKLYRTFYIQSIGKAIPDDFFTSISSKIPNLSFSSIEIKPMTDEDTSIIINQTVSATRRKINKYKEDKARKFIIDDYLPPALAQENENSVSIYKDVTERDQRLYACTILLTITAQYVPDKKELLEEDEIRKRSKAILEERTKVILEEARSKNVVFQILYNQQMQGLFETIPFGINSPIEIKRTMTTESIAAFVPFSSQAVQSYGQKATWIGINPVTKKVNSINRANLLNGNGLIYGVSGSGKSVQSKIEIIEHWLKEYKDAEILIIDPNGEYSKLVTALGGASVDISVGSPDRINLMDLNSNYGSDDNSSRKNPIKAKIGFLQQVIALMCDEEVTPTMIRPIIDRCATRLYKPYAAKGYQGRCPTLRDLYNEIVKEKEDVAKVIALAIESYVFGSLNIFAENTNTPEDNGLCAYNLKDLDDNFMTYGHLVMIDQIMNRIAKNFTEGKWTYIYIDEIHTFFGTPAQPLIMKLWKMGRKNHCFSTGITQQIQDLLEYEDGQKIIGNSEFVQVLKCDELQLQESLQRTLSIPPSLMKYIRGEKNPSEKIRKSTGIIKYAGTVIPFESQIPPDTYLYQLINTD